MKKLKINLKRSPVIFIYSGIFPKYGYDSILHNSKFNNNIILICNLNKINKSKISRKVLLIEYDNFQKNELDFLENNKKISKFWIYTIERYFILRNFVKHYKIENFFHVELDNLVNNLNNLDKKLDKFRQGIYLPFNPLFYRKNGSHNITGSFIYINKIKYLDQFCNYSKNVLKKKFFNDMELLTKFSRTNSNKVNLLPTVSSLYDNKFNNIRYDKIGGIFDEARIGQFLFGIDPILTNGFLYNRDPKLDNFSKLLNNLKFSFNKKFFFNLLINGKKIHIYNLHIHSKLIREIFNNKFYVKIINRINDKKKTLINFNIKIFIQFYVICIKNNIKKLLKCFLKMN